MEKNKVRTYIFYAVGEIALVMVGILLALQVNNWNEERMERNRESDYLDRLEENLVKDIEDIDKRIEFYQQVEKQGELAINDLEGRTDPDLDRWTVLVSYFKASQIWPLLLNDITHDELKSAGELDLIRSVDLRSNLNSYYTDLYTQYENTIGDKPIYREKIRSKIAFEVQEQLWNNCILITDNYQELLDCRKPENLTTETVDEVLSQINNEEILEDLRFWMTNLYVGLIVLDTIKREAGELINSINNIEAK